MHRGLRNYTVSVFLILSLFACAKDDIAVYQVPKEEAAPVPTAAAGALRWTTPAGWAEQPASGMRVGSFLVTGKNGNQADVSVVSLSGEAGGMLANVNRWRDQIGLPALDEAALKKNVKEIAPGGRRMFLVDFTSRDNLILDKFKKRVLAAVWPDGETTWFIKMMGEEATVEEARPALLKFLESLKTP